MSGNRQFKFEYTGIRVKDMDESISFYTDVLGMKLVGRGSTEATKGVWAQLKSEGSKHLLELNWYAADSPFYSKYRSGEELDHLCFSFDFTKGGLNAALKEFKRNGVRIAAGPYTIGDWKIAHISDTNGIWIELGEHI